MNKFWRGVDPKYLKKAELDMLKWADYLDPNKDEIVIRNIDINE